MSHFYALTISILIIELIIFFKIKDEFFLYKRLTQRIFRILGNKIASDERKEFLLKRLSIKMFISSLKLFFVLMSLTMPIIILSVTNTAFYKLLFSYTGIFEFIILGYLYLKFRATFINKT